MTQAERLALADLPMYWQGRANALRILQSKAGTPDTRTETEIEIYEECTKELRAALRSLPRDAAPAADMARLSASEHACYRWPEDTTEHRAMRAAFMDGAAHIVGDAAPAGEAVAWQYRVQYDDESWSYWFDCTEITYNTCRDIGKIGECPCETRVISPAALTAATGQEDGYVLNEYHRGYRDGWETAHSPAACGHARANWKDSNYGTPEYKGKEVCEICTAAGQLLETRKAVAQYLCRLVGQWRGDGQCPHDCRQCINIPESDWFRRADELLRIVTAGQEDGVRAALVETRKALSDLKNAVEASGKLNSREYIDLGIQVNRALDRSHQALASLPASGTDSE